MDTTAVRPPAPGIGAEVLEAVQAAQGAVQAGGAAKASAPGAARTKAAAAAKGGATTAKAGSAKSTKASGAAPKATATKAKATKTKATSAKATTAKATTASSKSLEDKLFAFMKDYVAKVEKQIDELIEGKKPQAKASGGSGSLLDVVTGAVPVLGELQGILGKSATRSLLGTLGAGLLGGIASVVGTPVLGAIVTQVAPSFIDAALGATVGGTAAPSSSGSSSSSSASGGSDQLQLMEVQRLQGQLQRMFETVSNILKSRHDTQMAAIHNLR